MATWVWIALGIVGYVAFTLGMCRWLHEISEGRDRRW